MSTIVRTKKWPIKDPEEKYKYGHTYRDALLDPVQTSVWTVPAGMTGVDEEITEPNLVTIWLSGGVLGQEYTIKNVSTLLSGSIIVRRVILQVMER